jgi:hypothetical protein
MTNSDASCGQLGPYHSEDQSRLSRKVWPRENSMKQEYVYERENNELRVVHDEERGLARRAPA